MLGNRVEYLLVIYLKKKIILIVNYKYYEININNKILNISKKFEC